MRWGYSFNCWMCGVQTSLSAHSQAATKSQAGALLVTQGPPMFVNRKRIVDLASKSRLPAMYMEGEWPNAGGLMSYGAHITDSYRSNYGLRPAICVSGQERYHYYPYRGDRSRPFGYGFGCQSSATGRQCHRAFEFSDRTEYQKAGGTQGRCPQAQPSRTSAAAGSRYSNETPTERAQVCGH